VVCLGCQCVCADIVIDGAATGDQQVPRLAGSGAPLDCSRGRHWLTAAARADQQPTAWINGRPVELEAAIDEAARILRQAQHALVCGMSGATVGTVRSAMNLAAALAGSLDWMAHDGQAAGSTALARVGRVTCTLDELRDRSDLIIVWQCDPVTTHPRLLPRFVDLPGRFVETGRAGRRLIHVGAATAATARMADQVIELDASRGFEAIGVLRALVHDVPLDRATVLDRTGVELSVWRELHASIGGAHYTSILLDASLAHEDLGASLVACYEWVRQLNDRSRCAAILLNRAGDLQCAADVLTWRIGLPGGVRFADGGAASRAGASGAAYRRLVDGVVDAVVVVGANWLEHLSTAARARLDTIPTLIIDPVADQHARRARVAVRAAPWAGADDLVVRLDGVPVMLPEGGWQHSSIASVLDEITRRVRSRLTPQPAG
jgi:formylmethanofuran dehydrogenase subunit B